MMIFRLLVVMVKKVFIIFLPLFLAALVFGMYVFFSQRQAGKGALQVTSIPKSQVFLDERLLGSTPLCKCEPAQMITAGEHILRLVPQESQHSPFEQKIHIVNGILTVVDRTFAQGASSEGSIITLDPITGGKASQLLVVSFPQTAEVLLDSNSVGKTPFLLKDISESDHEVRLRKSGYKDKVVRIHATSGYKLSVLAFLGVDMNFAMSSSSAQLKTLGEKDVGASLSASLTKVVIQKTPTGFLRVRKNPSTGAAEIARVNPGETYELIEEKAGWFRIRLLDGGEGWVSTAYAKKQ